MSAALVVVIVVLFALSLGFVRWDHRNGSSWGVAASHLAAAAVVLPFIPP